MRKVAALLTAASYFGFSHYCLAAVVTGGVGHHPPALAGETAGHGHDHGEHDHGGHGDSQAPVPHGEGSDDQDACCVSFAELGAALRSAAPSAAILKVVLFVLDHDSPVEAASPHRPGSSFPNHDPPRLVELEAYSRRLAGRPPPSLPSL